MLLQGSQGPSVWQARVSGGQGESNQATTPSGEGALLHLEISFGAGCWAATCGLHVSDSFRLLHSWSCQNEAPSQYEQWTQLQLDYGLFCTSRGLPCQPTFLQALLR